MKRVDLYMDSVQTFIQYAWSGLNFLIIITVLVFVHELGHFLAAKAMGMHVEAFAVMVGGIRKTDLSSGLSKQLMSSRIVGILYGLALLMSVFAAIQNQATLYLIGLALVAFVFPIWIASRIGTLYRQRPLQWIKPIGIAYAVAWLMLGVSTKGVGFGRPADFLLMSFYASLVGLLVVYYSPLTNRPEEGKMGHGAVIEGGEVKEVRFRPVASFTTKAGTEFSLLALPLGGFARMRGMEPHADGSETKIEGGFYSKSPLARLVVLFAGPLFSILLGCVLFFTAFATYGDPELIDVPVLDSVSTGGPASRAGLIEGDKVVSIDGKPVKTFYDIVLSVRESKGKSLSVEYVRNGEVRKASVVPEMDSEPSIVFAAGMKDSKKEPQMQYKLQAGPPKKYIPVSTREAALRAISAPVAYGAGLATLLSKPQEAAGSLSGPATIAKKTHGASEGGLNYLLYLAAILSTSLGFMNLLPIPPLDGGQMVVAIAEMFRRGKRLSLDTQATLTTVGMGLVMMLMLLVFSQDAGKLLGGK
ncbi:MAG: site-2 protease family protein [Chthonomonas sp.]|nr:site-2 protease family protein [Chthonomonas sp.]